MMTFALALLAAQAAPSLEAARGMAPEALAAALLGPGHPPVARVIVHPVGMEPASRSLRRVTFIGVPGPAPDRPGWCRRVDRYVRLVPVEPGAKALATAVPTRVERVEDWQRYRLADETCGRTDATFFAVRESTRDAQFALMARLQEARRLARNGKRLPFALHCVDDAGADNAAYGGDACQRDAGRALLARLPLDHAFNVSVAGDARVYSASRPVQRKQVDAAVGLADGPLTIDAAISEDAHAITAIELKRHVPYPF